ncbi:hypothetical protein VQ056_04620 [Paenibacillus sp. JTLBN-2024]
MPFPAVRRGGGMMSGSYLLESAKCMALTLQLMQGTPGMDGGAAMGQDRPAAVCEQRAETAAAGASAEKGSETPVWPADQARGRSGSAGNRCWIFTINWPCCGAIR